MSSGVISWHQSQPASVLMYKGVDMKSAYVALKGHLKNGGELLLANTSEACRKGAIASNKAKAEKRKKYEPPVLNWRSAKQE